jgi:hypothetical protein
VNPITQNGLSKSQIHDVAKQLSTESRMAAVTKVDIESTPFHLALMARARRRILKFGVNDPKMFALMETACVHGLHVLLDVVADEIKVVNEFDRHADAGVMPEGMQRKGPEAMMVIAALMKQLQMEREVLEATAHAGLAVRGATMHDGERTV